MSGPRPLLRLSVCVVALAALAVPTAGAQQDDGRGEVMVRVVKLAYQSAGDAVALVYPMLSGQGTVELQPGKNTLVLRDRESRIERILSRLQEFDQPASAVRIGVQIVSAGTRRGADFRPPELPPELLNRLRELLRYRDYVLLGQAEQEVRRGQETVFDVGDGYQVHFRLGKSLGERRLSLEGFRIMRRDSAGALRPLIHTNLNLNMDKPMVLGLAKTESSDHALMVVLDCLDPKTLTARK